MLGPGNGSADARVAVVATAPGRRGAERTGVPLSGDASGRMFEEMLAAAGLTREDVFVTNAVLCNPQDAAGRNREPSRDELRRCSVHLRATLAALTAPLVVTLGRTAHAAVVALGDGTPSFDDCFGTPRPWEGRLLASTFHPSPRVTNVAARRRALLDAWLAAVGFA